MVYSSKLQVQLVSLVSEAVPLSAEHLEHGVLPLLTPPLLPCTCTPHILSRPWSCKNEKQQNRVGIDSGTDTKDIKQKPEINDNTFHAEVHMAKSHHNRSSSML